MQNLVDEYEGKGKEILAKSRLFSHLCSLLLSFSTPCLSLYLLQELLGVLVLPNVEVAVFVLVVLETLEDFQFSDGKILVSVLQNPFVELRAHDVVLVQPMRQVIRSRLKHTQLHGILKEYGHVRSSISLQQGTQQGRLPYGTQTWAPKSAVK